MYYIQQKANPAEGLFAEIVAMTAVMGTESITVMS